MITDPQEMNEALIGLGDVNVLGIEELKDSSMLHIVIETKNQTATCPQCGMNAKLKDRPQVELNDLTSFGRKVKLTWIKRRFTCNNDKCSTKSFVEQAPSIANSRLSISDRAAKFAVEQVGKYGRPVNDVALQLGSNWHTVNDAVMYYGTQLINDKNRYQKVEAVGLDETLFEKIGEFNKQHYSTQISDVKKGQLLDIVPGRSGDNVKTWFNEKDEEFKENRLHQTLNATLSLSLSTGAM